jgi:hypothetical protein
MPRYFVNFKGNIFNLDYSQAKPPTQPNFNVGKAVAREAVFVYCEWATTKPVR